MPAPPDPPAFADALTRRVGSFILRRGLLEPDARVLVGVSGGRDSVALFDLLVRLGYAVGVAHVNYGLRGAASDADAAFVRALADDAGVACHTAEHPLTGSVQDAAREARYAFFRETAEREGYAAVAVAHHRDDQAETILLQLLRGAGPEGLGAMRAARALGGGVRLVRPLLDASRDEIVRYAEGRSLRWRHDATNDTADYRRNAVRHDVMPVLQRHFGPDAAARLAHAADLVGRYVDDDLRPSLAARFAAAAAAPPDAAGALHVDVLRGMPAVWRDRVILEAFARYLPTAPRSAATAAATAALLHAQPGRRFETAGGTVWRGRGRLVFVAPGPAEPTGGALRPGGAVAVDGGIVRLDEVARPERLDVGAPATAYVDLDRLGAPLIVRPWRRGDRIRPLGFEGTRRVSDVLTDARVAVHRRASAAVVTAGDVVVWVVGVRLADAARVRPTTERVGRFVWEGREMAR